MNSHTTLEFNVIIEKLKEHALSDKAKQALEGLAPYMDENICTRKMNETTSALALLNSLGSPPLPLMKDFDEILKTAETGGMLIVSQLSGIIMFASSCKRTKAYLSKGESAENPISLYGRNIEELTDLRDEIERCVNGEDLHDTASPALKSIRRKKLNAEAKIKENLSKLLQSKKQYLTDGYITVRQGRYVLPVQKKFQSQFGGTVIESSGKGGTVFMEPSSIARLQEEFSSLAIEEDAETRRILYVLTAMVADYAGSIRQNMEVMERLDVLFAKAKLSAAMHASPVQIGGQRRLVIRGGRHPLLDEKTCVPLDFEMEESTSGVIITGPNTGGKTVAIKTVGLLSLMAQCGLHIPCAEGSYIAMQDGYWCDIGDHQDISQNLSTFSGHMTNVIHVLEHASRDSLVLLDELGSGTDPAEGMGIAIAVLEELRQRGCMFLVTTHYPQVKQYADKIDNIKNARMAFDRENLCPLYKLEIGKAGESCALHIAARLGLSANLLSRAYCEVYGEDSPAPLSDTPALRPPKSRLVRAVHKRPAADVKFFKGDSVTDLSTGEIAIVYRPADDNGDVIIQVKGEKRKIKHTRLKLKVAASELYPPDYDFSIIFDTVENRKARNKMDKGNGSGLSIVYGEFDE